MEAGGKIKIGDNVRLIGSMFGTTYVIVSVSSGGGSIEIGNGAIIVNDASLAHDTDTYGDRQGVFAAWGGAIEIGDGVSITTNAGGIRNHGLAAGSWAYGTDTVGRITVGDDARIEANGNRTYGVYAVMSGSEVTVGQRAVIAVNGPLTAQNNYGVFAYLGGEASIGDGSEVTVHGNESYGFHVVSENDVAQTDKSQVSTGNGVSVTTTGGSSHGVVVFNDVDNDLDGPGAVVIMGEGGQVGTSGDSSFGLFASGRNAVIETGRGLSVGTAGTGSVGAPPSVCQRVLRLNIHPGTFR